MFLRQAAKGNNSFLVYLITIISIPLGYFIGSLPIDLVLRWAVNRYDTITATSIDEFYGGNPDFSLFNIDKNVGLILMICIFVGVLLVLYLGVKYLHKRPFRSLITPENAINWNKIFFSFGFWIFLSISFECILYILYPGDYSFHFEVKTFIPLLLIGLLILPIQTTTEELVFRGYLLQGIVHFYKAPWLALLITSILFGLVHSANPEIAEYGAIPMQMYYVGAGLFLGLITIFDNSLELAIGIHAATNFFGAVVVTYEGSVLQTDTLFKTSQINPWVALLIFALAAVIFMLICAKKYKWESINALFKKLDTISSNEML